MTRRRLMTLLGLIGFGAKSAVGFFPFADGIAPASYRDQDDYAAIRPRLACSLTGTCSQ